MSFTGDGSQMNPYIVHNWEEFESLSTIPEVVDKLGIYIKWADSDNKVVDFKNEVQYKILWFNNILEIDFNGWTFKNIVSASRGQNDGKQFTLIFGNKRGSDFWIRNGTFIYSNFSYGYSKTYSVDNLGNREGLDDSINARNVAQVRAPIFYLITRQVLPNYLSTVNLDRMNIYVNCDSIDNYNQGDFTIIESSCNFTVNNGNWSLKSANLVNISNSIISITYDKIPNEDNRDWVYNTYDFFICASTRFANCEIDVNIPTPKYKLCSTDSLELTFVNNISLNLFTDRDSGMGQNRYYNTTLNIKTNSSNNSETDFSILLGSYNDYYSVTFNNLVVDFNDTNVTQFIIFPTTKYSSNIKVDGNAIIFSKNGDVYYKGSNVQKPTGLLWVNDEYSQTYESLKYEYDKRGVILDNGIRIEPVVNPADTYNRNLISNPLINNGKPTVSFNKYPIIESSKLNRSTNAKLNKFAPSHIKYQGSDIKYVCIKNKHKSPIWQSEFDALFESQTYGNWLNDLGNVQDNKEKQRQVTSTFKNYLFNDISSIALTHILDNESAGDINTLDRLGYDDISTHSFKPAGLSGLKLSNTDGDGLQYFKITEKYLNLLNFTIAIVSDITNINKTIVDDELHYLFTLPISADFEENNSMLYVANKYIDGKLVYVTNITEDNSEQIITPDKTYMNSSFCDIFIITCNTINISLYVNGVYYDSNVITEYSYKPDVVQKPGTIGYFSEDKLWVNNFVGNILAMHLFSYCFNAKYIWKLFTECRHIIYKNGEIPEDSIPT